MRSICCLLLLAGLVLLPDENTARGQPRRSSPSISTRRYYYPTVRSRSRTPIGFLASAYTLGPLGPINYVPVYPRIRIYAVVPPPSQVVVIAPPALDTAPGSPPDDPDVPPVPEAEVPRVIVPDVPPPDKPMPPMPPPPKPEDKPPPKKDPVKPPPKKDEPKEPELPRPPAPADDPRDEAARLIERGQESFKELEYGRAAQRFRQAIRLVPGDAMPRFLLAQALLAQGKYHEAHDSIVAGLERNPDWPTATFRPLEMYGAAVGEYPEHLAALEEALRRHPDDPVLLFLTAYQLWFDGRKEEARPLLHRALPRAKDPEAINRFLRALPEEEL